MSNFIPPVSLLRNRPSIPSINPADIAGLALWLRSDDLILSNNDPVAIWPDASGTLNHATQVSPSLRPTFKTGIIHGKPVLRFDGANDFLSLTADIGTSDFSVFVVAALKSSPVVQTNYAPFFVLPYGTNYGCQMVARMNAASTNWGACSGQENAFPFGNKTAGEDLVANVFNILNMSSSFGTGTTLYRNGVFKAYHGSGALGVPSIGVGGNSAGCADNQLSTCVNADFAEVIVFNRILTTPERNGVVGFLHNKYGIAVTVTA